MSAYISSLTKQIADKHMQGHPVPSQEETFKEKHDIWFSKLPPASKHRHWSIDEIASVLKIAPRELSQTLLDAGWLRKRVWFERSKGQGRYLRVWLPPISKR